MSGAIDTLANWWDGEELVLRRDRPTGAWMIVALHSSVLGPAAGGTRMKSYPHLDAAVEDALRLSAGMTYKFATPGLPFGGAKAVLSVPETLDPAERPGLLRRYGELIADLNGSFLTGPDVGTSPDDMDVIGETAGPHVFCRTPEAGGAGDPGPYTALGVYVAIETVCDLLGMDIAQSRVVVQGAGDVGGPLIERLVAAGADVAFSEVNEALIRRYGDERGVEFVAADRAVAEPCDVFAPCALGAVLNEDTIPLLQCQAVVGSANNQLGTLADGERLRTGGIRYAPDFVANVGGAMALPGIEALGWDPDDAAEKVKTYVAQTLRNVFAIAERDGITTDAAARRLAERNLVAAVE